MWSRRQFIKGAGAVAGAAGFPLLAGAGNPLRGKAPAKSIIQIWMWGGASHLDTFDPKPEAGADFCGPLANPIETNVSGIRIGEQFPMLAKQADKYSIIRLSKCSVHKPGRSRFSRDPSAFGKSLNSATNCLSASEASFGSTAVLPLI